MEKFSPENNNKKKNNNRNQILTRNFLLYSILILLSFLTLDLPFNTQASGQEKNEDKQKGEDTFNEYEKLLLSAISDMKKGKLYEAKEKFDELKREIDKLKENGEKTIDILKLAFPQLSKKYNIAEIMEEVEKELLSFSKKEEKRKSYFSKGEKVKKIFVFPSSDGKSEFFESFENYIQDEFEEYFVFFDSYIDYDLINNRSIIINFADRKKINIANSGSFLIDFSSPTSITEENIIYFLPHFSHFAWTINLFIKNEVKCSPIILYREDVENMKKIFYEVSYAAGVSIPYDIKYSGIDVIPFIRKKFEVHARKEGKKSEREILEFAAEKIQKSGCIIILDNSKNSSAIIPQIRFIGAKDIKFFGIMWHRIKDYLEKRYYNTTFYADIVPPGENRQKIYISDLQKITEILSAIGDMFKFSKQTEIKGMAGKIVLTPKGIVIRGIKIFQVGEDIKPVFELEPEAFKDKLWE
jgi:hypothetical protein